MKVVLWDAQPARLHKIAREDNIRRLNSWWVRHAQSHGPLISIPAVLGLWEQLRTGIAAGHCQLLHLGASKIQMDRPLDRCHSCLLPTHLHRATAPTSVSELHRNAARMPQQPTFMVHFFPSVGTRAIVPASESSHHSATTGNGQSLSSVRHR